MATRVLVIDDDAAVRGAIKKVLENAEYEVTEAVDGAEGIRKFTPEQVDLILLDLDMPGLPGWEVFERLTTHYPLVPILIITGLPNQQLTALHSGAAALMEKPLDVPALLETIKATLAEPAELRLLRLTGYLHQTRHVPAGQAAKSSRPRRSERPGHWRAAWSRSPLHGWGKEKR